MERIINRHYSITNGRLYLNKELLRNPGRREKRRKREMRSFIVRRRFRRDL